MSPRNHTAHGCPSKRSVRLVHRFQRAPHFVAQSAPPVGGCRGRAVQPNSHRRLLLSSVIAPKRASTTRLTSSSSLLWSVGEPSPWNCSTCYLYPRKWSRPDRCVAASRSLLRLAPNSTDTWRTHSSKRSAPC